MAEVMTDRELLELAAKAAGLTGECHLLTGDCSDPAEPGGFRYEHPDGGHDWWNPLMDDGDALRLAVRLEFEVSLGQFGTIVYLRHGKVEEIGAAGCDAMSLCRRAIVRAAAEIGKGV